MKEKIKKLWAKIKVHLPLIGVVALVGAFVLGLFFLSRWTEKEDRKMLSASAETVSDTISYYIPEEFSLIEPMTFEGQIESTDEYTISFLNEERLLSPYTCISSTFSITTYNDIQSITIRLSDYFSLKDGYYSLNFFVPDSLNEPMRSVEFLVKDVENESSYAPYFVEAVTIPCHGYGKIYSIYFSYAFSGDPLDFIISLRNSRQLTIYDLQLYYGQNDYYTPYPSSRTYSVERLHSRSYEQGYEVGNSEGYNYGYEEGYHSGYNSGMGDGYADGYAEAKESLRDEIEQEVLEDKETFLDGIFAIFDAPLRITRDIFNFELFGINISDLVMFILTAIIVVIVVKKLKGG